MKEASPSSRMQGTVASDSSLDEIGGVIESARAGEVPPWILIELLSERHPVYKDRPGYQMTRIRGYCLASFAKLGLPDPALNFVLDELQNGKNAYVVAAAARGLRGAKRQSPQYVSFLLQAMANVRYTDDSLTFEEFSPSWPLRQPTTAKKEILLTLQWLGGYAKAALPLLESLQDNPYDFDPETRELIKATLQTIKSDDRALDRDCCEIEGRTTERPSRWWAGKRNIREIGHLPLENQCGDRCSLAGLLDQKVTVVAFFYTRCMNPNKCTLTLNKLGWLQQDLRRRGIEEKVNLVAFTYDPAYDAPARMRIFGDSRGVVFNANMHLVRTRPEDFDLLSDFFQLGVNRVDSTINQHRLELFLVDQKGNLKVSYTRLQWEIENVLGDIHRLLEGSSRFRGIRSVMNVAQQVGFPIVLAVFPKCPVCWAAYLSAFGVSGLQRIPFSPWLVSWVMLGIVVNLVMLYRMANVRNGHAPFWISLSGGLLVAAGYCLNIQPLSIVGVVLILAGSIANSLPASKWSKLTHSGYSIIERLVRFPYLSKGR